MTRENCSAFFNLIQTKLNAAPSQCCEGRQLCQNRTKLKESYQWKEKLWTNTKSHLTELSVCHVRNFYVYQTIIVRRCVYCKHPPLASHFKIVSNRFRSGAWQCNQWQEICNILPSNTHHLESNTQHPQRNTHPPAPTTLQ